MHKPQLLPPAARTPIWQRLSAAAKTGEFILQVCQHCNTVQYPPRELCKDCLHDELEWQQLSAQGELVCCTVLQASTNAFFREHGPCQVALVKLDCGPLLFAHMACSEAGIGERITVINRCDLSGEGVFIAIIDAVDKQKQLQQLKSLLSADN